MMLSPTPKVARLIDTHSAEIESALERKNPSSRQVYASLAPAYARVDAICVIAHIVPGHAWRNPAFAPGQDLWAYDNDRRRLLTRDRTGESAKQP
jgi:hypothetical protein